ncbi:MAG: retention module-containing protein, partial [Aeromonadaceae bacterium]
MRTQTLQSPMAVVEFNGEVKVQAADGQLRMVKPGEVLPAGTVLQIADGAELRLEPPAAASSDATAAEQNIPATPAIPGEGGTTAEIAAIQKALLQGVDPTQLEATAAGGAPAAGGGGAGGSGNGGFITVSRTGDATLASAGFDTTYQSTTLAAAPVATGAVVDTTIVPAPVVTPDTNTLNESHLDANNPLDPDTVSGSQAGEAATLITGNLNIDFAGSTGSVVFQYVANQPALSSGGSPLVWSISSDGLTLTGSVGAVAILTVSINPDGTYTVDLDGPLDGDGLQPAFGIVATNAEGSATTGAIVITVADDVPTAADDSNGVREDGSELTVSGNVLSNDTQGADGASVTPQTVETALGTLE